MGDARQAALEERTLLEDVVARGDDRAIQVYADWLLERGSARGEFIVLQLKKARGGLSPEELDRERSLLEEHWHRWLGALAASVEPRPPRLAEIVRESAPAEGAGAARPPASSKGRSRARAAPS